MKSSRFLLMLATLLALCTITMPEAANAAGCSSEYLALSSALGQPTRTGAFGESLGNSSGAIAALRRCQAQEKAAKEAAAAAEAQAQAAAVAAQLEATRRAAAQQAAQEQQRQAQAEQARLAQVRAAQQVELQRQGQSKQDLMTVVSTAILEGRCEDAKTAALQANNLDLAEQAMRLCKPKPAAKAATAKGTAVKGKPSPVKVPTARRAEAALPPTAQIVSKPDWRRKPTAQEIYKYFPEAALKLKVGGTASISCAVNTLGYLEDCTVAHEAPLGLGFGDAALKMTSFMEMTPKLVNGVATSGGTVVIPIQFNDPTPPTERPAAPAVASVASQHTQGAAAYGSGDYATAYRLLRPLADRGDANSQNFVGVMYATGRGVPQDYAAAVSWYRKAADQGNAAAQFNLGAMYDNGQGGPQDYAAAVSWYRKAADQGYAKAQGNLGFMYKNGQGGPQDYAAAVSWYRKAADQGDANAQTNLGVMYHNSQGVAQDYSAALVWFRKGADQGDANAQGNLGVMYENGRGVAQDYAAAVSWYRKAADQGFDNGQTGLGVMYQYGRGVAQDYATAVSWFRRAADQGYALAQEKLKALCAAQPTTTGCPYP